MKQFFSRNSVHSRRLERLLCLLLFVVNLAVYRGVPEYDFVNFDDIEYVTENSFIRSGLSLEGAIWAFTTIHAGNWHPLTWLSHMLDSEISGSAPVMHHLSSLLLHMANTILLFLVLRRMTGHMGPSFLVAALFAVHPLNVESVAWVSERKNVLSTFFWLLTMRAYSAYVESPKLGRYGLVVLLFAMGLMSKPMLVTLPFLLLLFDYWPYGRFRGSIQENFQLITEKFPLILLSALSCIITFVAQKKAGLVLGLDIFPLDLRLSNALVSYVVYIGKMIWPEGLGVFYAHPANIPLWRWASAGLCLMSLSFLFLRKPGKYPYLAAGWLWYLGTLVPVIGLLHVGGQAMADRYCYVPMIGLFIMIAWGLKDLSAQGRFQRIVIGAAVPILILVFGIQAQFQVSHWRNSISLWEHTLKVTDRNYVAHNMLGGALAREGRSEEASSHFMEAIEIRPDYEKAHYYMGLSLIEKNKYPDAIRHLQKALEGNCETPEAVHDQLGLAHDLLGEHEKAMQYFLLAIRINPRYVPAHLHLGQLLEQEGRIQEAESRYMEALNIDPRNALPRFHLGRILCDQERFQEACSHYQKALEANPHMTEAYYNLGVIMERLGREAEAIRNLSTAVRIKPDHVDAQNNLGAILARLGRCPEAMIHFHSALRIRPDHEAARANLALCLQNQQGAQKRPDARRTKPEE